MPEAWRIRWEAVVTPVVRSTLWSLTSRTAQLPEVQPKTIAYMQRWEVNGGLDF